MTISFVDKTYNLIVVKMFDITLFTVGYTQDNINLDWYKISPVSAENLEMPQFELAEDEITTSDYSSPYSQSNNISKLLYEPRHDKTNIMGLRQAWIQTSLRIRAV
jgi:hypothetical protein